GGRWTDGNRVQAMATGVLAENQTSIVGRRVHAGGGAQGGDSQAARRNPNLGHPNGWGSPSSNKRCIRYCNRCLNPSFPSRATAFAPDATRIRPSKRPGEAWRKGSAGAEPWTW